MAHYPEVMYWKNTYGHPGVLDKRAVETFMDCETAERVSGLRNQLYAISQGKYDDALFTKLLGPDRKQRHGTYQDWAKFMLQWMAGYKS
ncbi:MAG: hypothetical protein KDD70_07625 [Bdellovibrionales bacterium]|nr:hypothetical protein [Bdellovibrionales bacterium]